MVDLVYNTIVAYYGNVYGLSNITINFVLAYAVAIIVSILIALLLRVPLLPNKPYRYSFDVSALYPTPIIAIGILSIFQVLNYTFIYNGVVLAIIIGILSAFFVKYLFYYVFPKPLDETIEEDI